MTILNPEIPVQPQNVLPIYQKFMHFDRIIGPSGQSLLPPQSPETQIQIQDTQRAYETFVGVSVALSPIATDANDFPQQIANVAMQSAAGNAFANSVSDWTGNFHQLWVVLQQITAQIGLQYTAMKEVEKANLDLALARLGAS
jgi:hypothetical protein